jgi:hypothetical protein
MEIRGMHSQIVPQEDEAASIPSRIQDASAVSVRVTPGPVSPSG